MIPAAAEFRPGMTTVGFIGSGMIGGTVARLSVAAGHAVVLSNSRGPDTLKDLAGDLGPLARAASAEDAGDAGPLGASWRQQPGEPVYGAPYGPMEDAGGRPAGEVTIRRALAAATR